MTRKRARSDIAPTLHPSTERRKWAAWTRWMALQKEHRIAAERMWAGTIASSFTADELALIADLMCPRDYALLESVKRASK